MPKVGICNYITIKVNGVSMKVGSIVSEEPFIIEGYKEVEVLGKYSTKRSVKEGLKAKISDKDIQGKERC